MLSKRKNKTERGTPRDSLGGYLEDVSTDLAVS